MIPPLDDLRRRVTELRGAAGLTQVEAADAAGVSQSFVAKLEAGDAVPNYRDAAELYNALEALDQENGQRVGDVMSPDVTALSPRDTVAEASAMMKRSGFSQLPVIEDGDAVGSVTSRDLLEAGEDDAVREHAAPAFPTVPGDTSVDAVAALLRSSSAVLVRGQDGIDGIVTAADVI